MDQQVVRRANAPGLMILSKEQLIEKLLIKSHECNTLAQANQQLAQENAAFRLQLQRTSGPRGPVNRTPESRFQADNLNMIRYIEGLHEEKKSLEKEIKEQQEIIENLRKDLTDLRTKIRRTLAFFGSI